MSLKDQVAAIMNDWGWTEDGGENSVKYKLVDEGTCVQPRIIARGGTDEWAADIQRAIALAGGSELAEKINQEALANLRRREGISDVRKGSKRKPRRATEDQAIPTCAASGD